MANAEELFSKLEQFNPQAARLAEAVSLAVRIEPSLLRLARLKLLANADAGAEADLWFSSLVQSRNPVGIVFFPEVVKLLRGRLASDKTMLEKAWLIVEQAHRHISPAILLEEKLAWLSLAGKDDQAQDLLRSAIATLLKPTRQELAYWVARAFRLLPDEAKRFEEAQMLYVGANLRLGLEEEVSEALRDKPMPDWVSWMAPADLQEVSCGVELYEDAIELSLPPSAGTHVFQIPDTNPLLVEVSWEKDSTAHVEQIRLQRGHTRIVELDADEITLRTMFGKAYRLSAIKDIWSRLDRVGPPRVQITYAVEIGGAIEERELPFVVGVLGDFSGKPAEPLPELKNRKFTEVDRDNLMVLANMNPRASFRVNNRLSNVDSSLHIDLRFKSIEDFTPDNLVRQIKPLNEMLERRQCLYEILIHLDTSERFAGLFRQTALNSQALQAIAGQLKIDWDQASPADRLEIIKRLLLEEHAITDETEISRFAELIAEFISHPEQELPVDETDARPVIESRIETITKLLSAQLSEIMHHEEFQRLEATWRGLNHLVYETETGSLLKIKVMNVSKKELLADFEAAVEINQSSLFAKVYEETFGIFDAAPFGCLVGDFEFTNHPQDVGLLKNISNVAAAAHAPFISSASPELFGWHSFNQLIEVRDLAKVLERVEHVQWRSFRDSEDSRYVGLCLPRTLMRLPYSQEMNPVEAFNFEEDVDGLDHKKYLWGNTAYSFATRITDAFARYKWCAAIRGVEGGGLVYGLPTHTFRTDEGEIALKCPTEIAITDRREKEFSDLGFIPLVHCKNTDYAAFFSVPSCHKPQAHGPDTASANMRIANQFSFIFALSRFAHYLQVMMRDKIGSFMSREEAEEFLNLWISNYVMPDNDIGRELRTRRPLREGRIEIAEDDNKPGYYKAIAYLLPHFQLDELEAPLRIAIDLPAVARR